MRDDGYDISDYRRINKQYGTRRDFRRLVREAHNRGIRVITELVINHTSDQHPWFQAARRAPRDSAKRNYYVWSDSDDKYAGTRIIFTDTETSNWTWDPVAQQYFWHRFFSHQPDLNFDNPSVIRAVTRVMRYWLDMGVDGLRLDAIPYLVEREGTSNENLPETHAVVKQMRSVVDRHYQGRMFLGEANMWPEDVLEYFGDGDECHMAYHFPLMPRMYMALAQEDRHPIVEILEQTPAIPENCQWAMFLRNHDELTLEMVTDEERDYMYQTYASDPRARINVGIRRRLAPLLGNDEDKIKLLTSLLLSMPGSPILYYGDEIGMGDNIYLGDRNGVRTPMQWSPDRNAGFSRADPQRLYLPPVMDAVYGYEAVNVEAQSRETSSLLNWTRRMIAVRKSTKAFGRGRLTLLSPGNRHVFAYLREYDGDCILCVANLAGTAQPVELDLSRFKGQVPVEMMGRSSFPPIGELPYFLTIAGHGFFWFRLTSEASVPEWHSELPPNRDLVTLVLSRQWDSFFPERLSQEQQRVSENMLRRLTSTSLPRFLSVSRWFPHTLRSGDGVGIGRRYQWPTAGDTFLLLRLAVPDGNHGHDYLMPLALAWGGDQAGDIRELLPHAVARVRDRANIGLLYEAVRKPAFCRAVLEAIIDARTVDLDGARLIGTPTSRASSIFDDGGDGTLELPPSGHRHTSALFGHRVVIKLLRKQMAGERPELEISRFLTEQGRFDGFPRLAGDLAIEDESGRSTLAIAIEYRRNQGDAGRYLRHHLDRYLDEARLKPRDEARSRLEELDAQSSPLLQRIGRRTGELHRALADGSDAFAPIAIESAAAGRWKSVVLRLAGDRMSGLAGVAEGLPDADRQAATRVLEHADGLLAHIDGLRTTSFRGLQGRYHGDLHLGRILITEGDVVVCDFADDPLLAGGDVERRHSPLRDLAELLCSLYRVVHMTLRGFAEAGVVDDNVSACAVEWQRRAAATVVDSYCEAIDDSGLAGPDREALLAVTEIFVLERLLHEIGQPHREEARHDRGLPIRCLAGHLHNVGVVS